MTNAEKDSKDQIDLKVDITVVRANQLPDLRATLGKRQFYVVVDVGNAKEGKKKTRAKAQSKNNSVIWNETLNSLQVHPSSQVIVSIYAKHRIGLDELIGTTKIDLVPLSDVSFTLTTTSVGPDPTIVLTINVYSSQNLARLSDTSTQPIGQTDAIQSGSVKSPLAEPVLDGSRVSASSLTHDSLEDIGQDASKETYDAVNAMKNVHLLDEWKGAMENMAWLMKLVEGFTDIHPVAQAAWKIISAIPKAFTKQIDIDTSVQDLVKSIQAALALTKERGLKKAIKSYSNQALLLKAMLIHIISCSGIIKTYAQDESFRMRLLKNLTGGARDEIEGMCASLANMRDRFLDSSVVNTQIAVNHMQLTINHMHNALASAQKSMTILLDEESCKGFDTKLNDLTYDSGWSATVSKSRCLEGTRTEFIDYITKWINDPCGPRGLILLGQLGTGKSTIAHEIAYRFYFESSYFSFSRAKKSTQKEHHLLTTVICDIADRHPAFKRIVGELIADNRPLRTSDDIDQLFTTLLLGPLERLGSDITPGEVTVIVIDALDECVNPKKLAKFLSEFVSQIPSNFRVLITSRPESTILPFFSSAHSKEYGVLHISDDILAARVRDDILLYFKANLTPHVFQTHGLKLSEKAGGLFQWAAVACGYINEPPAGYTESDCLRGLLGSNDDDKQYTQELQSTKLYGLYAEVLSGYFTSKITRPRFCTVMGQLLCAFEPLSLVTLTGLRNFVPDGERDEGPVLAVLKFMGSLLSNSVSDDNSLPIIPLHISFRDFLTDTINTHAFSVDLPAAHEELTYACLNVMLRSLSFNICQLESSHLCNSEVEDLQSRIDNFISPALCYACKFWGDHLAQVPLADKLLDRLELLFTKKFLYWLEVLSLTNNVPLGVQAMNLLVRWLQSHKEVRNHSVLCTDITEHFYQEDFSHRSRVLIALVTDGRTFLRSFGTAIATSAPHIYVSALSFSPTSSQIGQLYSSVFAPTLVFKEGQSSHWPPSEMFITASSDIQCVDISPDGESIASGLDNGIIYVWNATTGMLKAKLTGHKLYVNSVAFSPDGRHIISGSDDCSLCLWDAATGTLVGAPWIGHQDEVNSVTFSPNGDYVVSGSLDKSIRLWNALDGSMNGTPLHGHTDSVNSVIFSADGERILSGSKDCTVRIWKMDVEDKVATVHLLFTLQAPDWVYSVAISPNGRQIAVGCLDNCVYLWDNPSEQTGCVSLVGHTKLVSSIKFSPNGQCLVSVSLDSKLILWDTASKFIMGNPLLGHIWGISSVAISADGQRIITGSLDCKIGIWNVDVVGHTLEQGHSDSVGERSVQSIAFLPDRAQDLIVSGMSDGTVCLWDAMTGHIFDGPLTGHNSGIVALGISPNGRQAVTASFDSTLCFWNISNNNAIERSTSISGHVGEVYSVAFSVDGQRIVSGTSSGEVRMWNATTGTQEGKTLIGCSGAIWSMCFSPDGHLVVGGSEKGVVWIWDISKEIPQARKLTSGNSNIFFVGFLSDGRKLISCSDDGAVRSWNPLTGEPDGILLNLQCGSRGLCSFALSPDGSLLAAASRDDFTITVWNLDTRTKEIAYPLIGHADYTPYHALAFSSDGQNLISGSLDSTIRIWNLSAAVTAGVECLTDVNWSMLDEEGWAYDTEGKLLLWVPQIHSSTFRRPNTTTRIISSHQTCIDFSRFSHGKDWTRPHHENQ